MDRSVSVNAKSDSDTAEFEPELPETEFLPEEAESPEFPLNGAGSDAPNSDLGPCLYFGPAGQRCDRRATEASFCARHQPGAIREALRTQVPRRALAALGVLAVLWPVLADLVRELIRFFR